MNRVFAPGFARPQPFDLRPVLVPVGSGVHDLTLLSADWKFAVALGAGALTAMAMLLYGVFRPVEDPEETERRRRLHLNQIGRIAEGQVVEVVEHPPESDDKSKGVFNVRQRPKGDPRPRHLVSYTYAISGVTYHTAQDITGLESQVRYERLVSGHPASVKYDPSNPTDSILVADDWSGLR